MTRFFATMRATSRSARKQLIAGRHTRGMGPITYFRLVRDILLHDPPPAHLDPAVSDELAAAARRAMGLPDSPYAALITFDEFVDRGHPGAMTTTQPKLPVPRTAAANEARSRRSQNTAAAKLIEAGWICFPPETADALRAVVATHDELTGWKA